MKGIKLLSIMALLAVISSLSTACSDDETERNLTYEMFQSSLKADMDYDAIVETFGEPDRDEGSGIHIYIYILNDNTEIAIGYAQMIYYAFHFDSEGMLLHTLIESYKAS